MRSLLFLLLVLWLACERQAPEKTVAQNRVDEPVLQENAQLPPTLEEQLRQATFAPLLEKPYVVKICYAFFDAPDQQMASHYFVRALSDIIQSRLPHTLACEFQHDAEIADQIWCARQPQDIKPAMFQQARQLDWLVAMQVSLSDRTIHLRTLHLETGRLGPKINRPFQYTREVASGVLAVLPTLLEWEGYLVEAADTKATVAMRGAGEELSSLGNFTAGRAFWVFQGKKRWRDCLWQIEKTWMVGDRLVASGSYCGSNAAQPGLRLMQACFTGGSQGFRLIDNDGQPLSGFSIFASYDNFTTEQENYRTTTDVSGEFTLQDQQKKPLFLTIARNVEGINFAFARKMLVLEDGKGPADITVTGVAEAQREAERLLPNRLEQKKIEEVQRTIRMRIEQTKEHLGKQQFNEAMFAIRLAQQSLKEIEKTSDVDDLRRALQVAEQNYQELFARKQAQENYLAASKLLEEADSDVIKLAYEDANAKVLRAREMWPARFYQQEFEEVTNRLERLKILIQQKESPLGQARRYIVEKAMAWKSEDITAQKLLEFDPHIRLFFAQGDMDSNKKYSDLEVWLQLRLLLDRLAHELSAKAQEYLQQYHQITSTQERQKIYEEHEKYYQCTQRIDGWLQNLNRR